MNDHQKRILDNAVNRILNDDNVEVLSFRRTDENFDGEYFNDPLVDRFYHDLAVILIEDFEISIKYKDMHLHHFKRFYVDWGLKILKNHGKLEEILNLSLL